MCLYSRAVTNSNTFRWFKKTKIPAQRYFILLAVRIKILCTTYSSSHTLTFMMYESKPAASAIPEKTDIAIHFPDVYFRIKSSGQKWITKKKINIK